MPTKTYHNSRYSESLLSTKSPAPKWAVLKIEVSDDQIVFHKKSGIYTYKWSDFTEAYLRSKISAIGTAVPTGRDIRERILFLKTNDGQEHILDLSVGYGNDQDESEFSPNPAPLLKILRIKLATVFRYEANTLKVKWYTPLAATMVGTAIFIGVFALLWEGDNLVVAVYGACFSVIPVGLVYYLNSKHWSVVAKPSKSNKKLN